jgi:hypothetical protein
MKSASQSFEGEIEDGSRTQNASSRPDLISQSQRNEVEKQELILAMLNSKAPSKFDAMHTNKIDQVHRDLHTIIDNFESVFVAYINQNYRTFTEKDL